MEVEAYRVSKTADGKSFCLPSEGYEQTVFAEIESYKLVAKGAGMLHQSDLQFPLGAPIEGYIYFEGSIYQLKQKSFAN